MKWWSKIRNLFLIIFKIRLFLKVFWVAEFEYRLQNFLMDLNRSVGNTLRWFLKQFEICKSKIQKRFLPYFWSNETVSLELLGPNSSSKTHWKSLFLVKSTNLIYTYQERFFFIITHLSKWECFQKFLRPLNRNLTLEIARSFFLRSLTRLIKRNSRFFLRSNLYQLFVNFLGF